MECALWALLKWTVSNVMVDCTSCSSTKVYMQQNASCSATSHTTLCYFLCSLLLWVITLLSVDKNQFSHHLHVPQMGFGLL